jgi:Protein of unknown function (DUF3108)
MRGHRLAIRIFATALLLSVSPLRAEETLIYRWHLSGFVGVLASIFVPSGGEGKLSVVRLPDGHLQSELVVTSSQSEKGDSFLYGAEWDPVSGRTVRAWSDLVWRGERKSKKDEVDKTGVIDVVSGIYTLRRDPPTVARRLEIWSDGRLYPVLVIPRESETRTLEGREVNVRHLSVRGLSIPDRRLWKGALDLWIADDPAATPVEIMVSRTGAHVRLIFAGREGEPIVEEAPGKPKE